MIVFVLASLACAGRGHREHVAAGHMHTSEEQQASNGATALHYEEHQKPREVTMLARLLLASSPVSAWQAGAAGHGLQAISQTHALRSSSPPWRARRGRLVRAMPERFREEYDPKNPDFAERIFAFFFGDSQLKSDTPFGLDRMSDDVPDFWPASKEMAEPIGGDTGEVRNLRKLLKRTRLETLPLKCVYNTFFDGWDPVKWHTKVDYEGPCLVVAKTRGGAVCGGYAPLGFYSKESDETAISAFLFTWPDGDMSKDPIKLRKQGGPTFATLDYPETGPRFGADGFTVMMQKGSEKTANSRLGPFYEVLPDKGRTIFSPKEGFSTELTELKTYVGEGAVVEVDGVKMIQRTAGDR